MQISSHNIPHLWYSGMPLSFLSLLFSSWLSEDLWKVVYPAATIPGLKSSLLGSKGSYAALALGTDIATGCWPSEQYSLFPHIESETTGWRMILVPPGKVIHIYLQKEQSQSKNWKSRHCSALSGFSCFVVGALWPKQLWDQLPPSVQFSSVSQSCSILCDPMDCSMPGFPVHHQLLELAQTHVLQVNDAIQSSHPLLSPSSPAFNLSQPQGLFQWVSSSLPPWSPKISF